MLLSNSHTLTSVMGLLARALTLDNGPGPVSESDDDQIISISQEGTDVANLSWCLLSSLKVCLWPCLPS